MHRRERNRRFLLGPVAMRFLERVPPCPARAVLLFFTLPFFHRDAVCARALLEIFVVENRLALTEGLVRGAQELVRGGGFLHPPLGLETDVIGLVGETIGVIDAGDPDKRGADRPTVDGRFDPQCRERLALHARPYWHLRPPAIRA